MSSVELCADDDDVLLDSLLCFLCRAPTLGVDSRLRRGVQDRDLPINARTWGARGRMEGAGVVPDESTQRPRACSVPISSPVALATLSNHVRDAVRKVFVVLGDARRSKQSSPSSVEIGVDKVLATLLCLLCRCVILLCAELRVRVGVQDRECPIKARECVAWPSSHGDHEATKRPLSSRVPI